MSARGDRVDRARLRCAGLRSGGNEKALRTRNNEWPVPARAKSLHWWYAQPVRSNVLRLGAASFLIIAMTVCSLQCGLSTSGTGTYLDETEDGGRADGINGPIFETGGPEDDAGVTDGWPDDDAGVDTADGAEDGSGIELDANPATCNPSSCLLGCNSTEARCNRVLPRNFDPKPFHDALAGSIAVAASQTVTVNTDSGSVASSSKVYRRAGDAGKIVDGIYWRVVSQSNGPDLSVFGIFELSIAAGSKIVVTGSHPVAFYVVANVTLQGVIEAKASGRSSGAGGVGGGEKDGANAPTCGTNSNGKGGSELNTSVGEFEAGGGGAGGSARGGAGGRSPDDTVYAPGGDGGSEIQATSLLVPLSGGCGGGAGGGPDSRGVDSNHGGYGGGGGGAIQVVAQSIVITENGGISVNGAAGQGGQHGSGGGGGGSGGSVFLQAAKVQQDSGFLVANGGGGGSGAPGYQQSGADGVNGQVNAERAAGGVGASYGGSGGKGGAGTNPSGEAGQAQGNGGGGGGAAGRIRIDATVYNFGAAGVRSPVSVNSSEAIDTW